MQREMTVAGWRRAWIAQARGQSLNRAGPRRRRTAPKVRRVDTKRWLGGWRKTQFGQGESTWQTGK